MAFREVTMLEVKDVLRLWLLGVPKKRIAKQLGFDVKTVRRYLAAARAHGADAGHGIGALDDALVMEVLFTFLSERYERRSVVITSNLVFKEWDQIFKNPMTTAAAIDRLIHHAVILEMTGTSHRSEEAKKRAEPATTTEGE